VEEQVLSLLCQKWPADFEEKLVAFIWCDWTLKKNSYLLSQMGNAEMPVYFDVPSNCTINGGAKCVVIKTLGYEKMCVACLVGGISRW
jgi:hypothetical protein